MRRYWIANPIFDQGFLILQGDDYHHIFEVCRFQESEEFELLGIKPELALRVRVVKMNKPKKQAAVIVLGERAIPALPYPRIQLNLCIPRLPVLEAVVEKAVEIGVWRMQLICSRYSFLRDPRDLSEARLNRLRRIITQATQQTGRGDLMDIKAPVSWENWCELARQINPQKGDLGLMAYESLGDQRTLKQALKELLKTADNSTQVQNAPPASPLRQAEIQVLIGSEGGFSPQEVEDMRGRGWQVIGLGSQILRVETACVVLVASLKYELGQW